MEVVTAVASWALSAACFDLPISGDWLQSLYPRAQQANYNELRDQLSSNAQIIFSNQTAFAPATARWSSLDEPQPNVVVVPGTEQDVATTVQFANNNSMPFLAYSGAHGSITTLGKMNTGIEINLSQLSNVKVAASGQTATIGGGTLSKNVTDLLWGAGKQTGESTAPNILLGPGLGGGHGWLQGHHGLVSDQWVSMNIVFANGSLEEIDSNSDLWWAMGGAGHNFGIVTSLTTKVYDIQQPNWAIETFTFSGDKVGAVYQAANDYLLQNGTQPVDVINWSYWLNEPSADPNNPVIIFYIIQEGVTAVSPQYTQPFQNIGPLSVQPNSGTYRDLAGWTGIALASPPCQKAGFANPRFPIYLQSYNVTAQQIAYNAFASNVNGNSVFNNSLFMFEGYSMQGVQAIADDASAFAFRSENLLTAPLIIYEPSGSQLDLQAQQLGDQLRQILYEGSGLSDIRAYVNYAYGDETPQQLYGSDQWRQSRLQALKRKYDPKGKFGFYAPIP